MTRTQYSEDSVPAIGLTALAGFDHGGRHYSLTSDVPDLNPDWPA